MTEPRSLRVTHPNRCDDYLTANGITCRVDKAGDLRVWSEGGFRMAHYPAGDWVSIHPEPLTTPTPNDKA